MARDKQKFHIVRVTPKAHELIQDLEQAYMRLASAVAVEAVDDAYAALSMRRKELYEYLQELERGDRKIIQVTLLRFD